MSFLDLFLADTSYFTRYLLPCHVPYLDPDLKNQSIMNFLFSKCYSELHHSDGKMGLLFSDTLMVY